MEDELEPKRLPLSTVTLVFGSLSVPLAFARHLCSLAFVLGLLALAFAVWGKSRQGHPMRRYTGTSVRNSTYGLRAAVVGTACSLLMWALYATNAIL
jgi:glucose uptake protein GlcU